MTKKLKKDKPMITKKTISVVKGAFSPSISIKWVTKPKVKPMTNKKKKSPAKTLLMTLLFTSSFITLGNQPSARFLLKDNNLRSP